MNDLIYLDHHATTPCDRRVAAVVQRMLLEDYGNASSQHRFGQSAADAVHSAAETIAQSLAAQATELVFTSGATESNSLALLGVCQHPRQKRRKIVTAVTEHPAVLDPIRRLEADGFAVERIAPYSQSDPNVGQVDEEAILNAIDDQTAVVSVMLANNEIGTIQPLRRIAEKCHQVGALLHCDATQAVGRIPVSVADLDVDLLSASAHKFYGPKGVGLLYIRQTGRRVRIRPQIEGGGQQRGLRSGTLNVPGIVGMGEALKWAVEEMDTATLRIAGLRQRLWDRLKSGIPELVLNGPAIADAGTSPADLVLHRLHGNLNVMFPRVEGEALMTTVPTVACSSGSACSSVDPAPSHVLMAIGCNESQARSSLRFGIGRPTTEQQIDEAADRLLEAFHRLRQMV